MPPDRSAPWRVVYYRTAGGPVPTTNFLLECPRKVRATILAALNAVALAPPPRFSGGGYWEAMHGDMGGYFEVRKDGPGREHFRLFCILDHDGPGLDGPAIVAIAGLRKPFRTKLSEADYAWVRRLGDDYKSTSPRRIAE